MEPKVLLIMTHPYSTSGSSRSLDAYFHFWPKDRVAQIFSRNVIPNKGHCAEMFQITDASLLRRWLHKINTEDIGKIYHYDEMRDKDGDEELQDTSAVGLSYKIGQKHSPTIELLRGTLWKQEFWCNKKLNKWLDSYKPDVVVWNFSNHLFTQPIVLYVAERYHIPVVAIIGDDYYFNYQKSLSPTYNVFKAKFRQYAEKILFRKGSSAVYACDPIKKKYNNYFYMNGETIYFNSEIRRREFQPINKDNPKIVYFGSIRLGRNKALLEIADALKSINQNYKIEVYASESDESIYGPLKNHSNVLYGGAIPYGKVKEKIQEADIFVIPESFAPEDINMTRYSLSTKAADGLASGVAILTYGPKKAGVVGYMAQTKASMVCTDPAKLKDDIKELIDNKDLQKKYYDQAIVITKKNHTVESSTAKFEEIVNKAIEQYQK